MILKFRDEVRASLETLRDDVGKHVAVASEFSQVVARLQRQVGLLEDRYTALQTGLGKDVGTLAETKEEFKKELFEFRLLKGQLQKKFMDKLQGGIEEELEVHRSAVKERREQFSAIEDELNEKMNRLTEIAKLPEQVNGLAASLKALEQQVATFQQTMAHSASEKAQLKRKIDFLERVIAKMKRRVKS